MRCEIVNGVQSWFVPLFVLGVERLVFFKQKTAYEVRISDWSSDVCSSDLAPDFEYSRNTDSEAANRCPADECYDAQHVMLPPPKVISSKVPDSRACRDISPAPSEARPIHTRRHCPSAG